MTIFSHTFSFFLSFCTKNNIYFPALFLYNHNHTCEKQKNKREGCGIQKNPAKKTMKDLIKKWNSISLIKRIICGLIIGLVLGLRNLDSRNHVRRSTERNRPASGILPGYECTLPHEVWSEDQFKIYYHFVHGW